MSDAFEHGYNQYSCIIRFVNNDGMIQFNLLIVKSRRPPKKFVSIARLELTTAVCLWRLYVCFGRSYKLMVSRKDFGLTVKQCYHKLEAIKSDSKCLLLTTWIRSKKTQMLIIGAMCQARRILSMVLLLGLIHKRSDSGWFNRP